MNQIRAKDIMSTRVITIREDASVKELADLFLKEAVSGVPVVDAQGSLVGMATEGDLIIKDARIHYPTYIHLLDGFIYLPGSISRFRKEFKKALGALVRDVMTSEVVTAREDTNIEDIATLMVDKNISRIPIMGEGRNIVGIVTKHDIVRSISKTT